MPRREHIICTAPTSGRQRSDVQRVMYPNAAPATAKVEMHDGSSFAAPLITPGPQVRTNLRNPLSAGGGQALIAFRYGPSTQLRTRRGDVRNAQPPPDRGRGFPSPSSRSPGDRRDMRAQHMEAVRGYLAIGFVPGISAAAWHARLPASAIR